MRRSADRGALGVPLRLLLGGIKKKDTLMSAGPRRTLSFYRYVKLKDPTLLRDRLRAEWECLGVLGRTYLAHEGINAQVSVPAEHLEAFQHHVRSIFPEIPFKIALEESDSAFAKLKIKVRSKLVADGLSDDAFDVTDVGTHLNAREFNAAMVQPGTIVVDMRNHYECEVGHFEGAILPDANTFREALPEVLERLADKKDRKILLYCTGGIRCEKASAWLKHHGFQDVNQLHGGIIDYARQAREEGLELKFFGKNFVFDQRMGERVTDHVVAHCHQCGQGCDEHTNCAYEGCNRLFIQCEACRAEFDACCSRVCQDVRSRSKEERIAIQQAWVEQLGPRHYASRTRVPAHFAVRRSQLERPPSMPSLET
jgi:UPF0176 protein